MAIPTIVPVATPVSVGELGDVLIGESSNKTGIYCFPVCPQ
jgi:hypothetical protein